MAIYSIKIIKDGRVLSRKQISKGLIQTDAVHLQAGADQAYLLSDALLENKSPSKIQTRRVGQSLHIALNNSSIAAPDVVIDGYFDFAPGPLLGTLGDGTTAAYDMNQVIALSQGEANVTTASSASAESGLIDPKPYGGFSALQLAGAAGVGVAALAVGGKGGGSSEVTAAQTAQTRINAYAADGSAAAPSVIDYGTVGVSGVTATNVAAINSAVDGLSAAEVDSLAKLQIVVDAYNKILSEANGSTADASPGNNPTGAQYAAIGANIGEAATKPENLTLLDDVLANKSAVDVDTIAEINALALAVNAVMTSAAGGVAVTLAQLALLGVTNVTTENLANVQAAIAATPDSGTSVNTLASLQAIVSTAASLTTLGNYAANGASTAPALTDYTQIAVTGVSATNLVSVNSAVDALAAADVATKAQVQNVVDAYTKILAEANGAAVDATPTSNPLAGDYAAIGANIGLAATNNFTLTLLNDVVGGLTSTAVDTVAELNALAAVVSKVIASAAGAAAGLSVADFASLGVATAGAGAVTSVNAAAVSEALSQVSGQNKVDTLAELQMLVTAVATIVTYADDNTQVAPPQVTYSNAGLTGVTSSNLAAINSAVDANTAASVDTKAHTQAVIDAYTAILAEANGNAPDVTPLVNPSAAQYSAVGANIGGASTHAEGLALLNDAIAGLSTSNIDTIKGINTLAATVNKVMNLAALATGSAIPTGAPSMAELSELGVFTALANTPAEQTAVWQAIIDSADSGSGVMTISQLQALVNAHAA